MNNSQNLRQAKPGVASRRVYRRIRKEGFSQRVSKEIIRAAGPEYALRAARYAKQLWFVFSDKVRNAHDKSLANPKPLRGVEDVLADVDLDTADLRNTLISQLTSALYDNDMSRLRSHLKNWGIPPASDDLEENRMIFEGALVALKTMKLDHA